MSSNKRAKSTQTKGSKNTKKDKDDDVMDVSEPDDAEEEQEEMSPSPRKTQPSRRAKSQTSTPAKPVSKGQDESDEQSENEIDDEGFAKPKSKKRSRKDSVGDDTEPTPASKRVKKGANAKKKTDEDEEDSLFDAVKSKAGIATAVTDLLKTYKAARIDGVLILLNFIFKSSGSAAKVDADEFESTAEEIQDLLKAKTKNDSEFNKLAKSNEYILASKGKDSKRFRQNFAELWKKLIAQAGSSIVLDGYLIQHLLHWIEALCQSTLRPFRHCATLAALDLCSSLIEAARQVRLTRKGHEQLSRAQGKNNKQVAATSQKSVDELTAKLKRIEDIIVSIMSNVVNDRTRDISEEIRVECAKHIGKWVKDYRELFLVNKYLKYLGWFLSDKSHNVRHASVDALIEIYEDDDALPQLDHFSKYYKDRLVAMTLDKDAPTACAAANLLSRFVKLNILDESDIQSVCSNIYDKDHRIREASGKFIVDVILDDAVVHQLPAAKTKKRKGTDTSTEDDADKTATRLRLKSLIELIQATSDKHPDVADYVVDALWGRTDALTSWEAMTELLSSKSGDDALPDEDCGVLARILNLSVRKAFGDAIVEGSKPAAGKEDARNENIQDYTLHLSKALPGLLTQYTADSTVSSYLVEIPRFFPLDAFATFRLKSNLDDLLKHLSDLFLKSIDPQIFDHVARTFSYLSQEHTYQRDVDIVFQEVVEVAVGRFREARDAGNRVKSGRKSDSSIDALLIATQRIDALASYDRSLHRRDESLFGDIISLLEARLHAREPRRGSSVGDIPEEVASLCIDVAVHQIMWELTKLVSTLPSKKAAKPAKTKKSKCPVSVSESVEEPSSAHQDEDDIPASQFTQEDPHAAGSGETTAANKQASIARLEEMSQQVFQVLPQLFRNDTSQSLRETAFRKVCWLLVAFTPALALQDPAFQAIVYPCDEELAASIVAFYEKAMASPTETDEEAERKLGLTQAFGATIIKNVLSNFSYSFAPSVLVHFVKHDQVVAEAIKTFLHQLRQNFADKEKEFIVGSLEFAFDAALLAKENRSRSEDVSESEEVSTSKKKSKGGSRKPKASGDDDAEDYENFSKLAHRLADSYGIRGNIKGDLRQRLYRVVLGALHLCLASPKKYARFVSEGLMPFVMKLDNTAAAQVLANIEARDRPIGREYSELDANEESSQPYLALKDACSRMSKGEKATPRKPAANGRGATAGRAKRSLKYDEEEEEEVPDMSSEEEEEADGEPSVEVARKRSAPSKATAAAARPRRKSNAKYAESEDSEEEDAEDEGELDKGDEGDRKSGGESHEVPIERKRSSRASQEASATPVDRKRSSRASADTAATAVDHKRSAPAKKSAAVRGEDDDSGSEDAEVVRKRSSKSRLSDDDEPRDEGEIGKKRNKKRKVSEIAPLYEDTGSQSNKPSQASEPDDSILEPALESKRAKTSELASPRSQPTRSQPARKK